jgi:hypothetical protein
MDFTENTVYQELRKQGHTTGTPYVQVGLGMMVVVDGVAMPERFAALVASRRLTVDQVAAGLARRQ